MAVELPQGEEKVRVVRNMFDTIAPRYDLVNRIMTFGLDRGWRRRTVAALALERGALVADLACGTGDLCRELQKQGLHAVGVDLSAGMLANARTSAPLAQADILDLPCPDASFDGITCGFALRNVTDLGQLFDETARVLRPAGRIAFLELAEPNNSLLRKGHHVYFGHVVPRIGGLLSNAAAYRYLPASMSYLPPTAQILARLEDAGYVKVERTLLSGGLTQLITATRA